MASPSPPGQLSPLLCVPTETRFRIYGYLIPEPRRLRIYESSNDRRTCRPAPTASSAEQEMRRYTRSSEYLGRFGQVAYTYLTSNLHPGSGHDQNMLTRTCMALMTVCWMTRSEVGPWFYSVVDFEFLSLKIGRIWNWTLTPATKALIRKVHLTAVDLRFRQEVRESAVQLRSLHGLDGLHQVTYRCHFLVDYPAKRDAWSNAEVNVIRQVLMIMRQCGLGSVYVSKLPSFGLQTDFRIVKSTIEKGSFEHVFPVQEIYDNLENCEKGPKATEINKCLEQMLAKENGIEETDILPWYIPSRSSRARLFALPVEVRTQIFSSLLPNPATIDMHNGSPNRDRLSSIRADVDTEEMEIRRILHRTHHHNGKKIKPQRSCMMGIALRQLWMWPNMSVQTYKPDSDMTRVLVNDCMALATTCKKFRQETLSRLYNLLEFNFTANLRSAHIAHVWNWTLTPETRSSIRSIALKMPHKDGLKKDSEMVRKSIKGMSGLREVLFTDVLYTVFTFDCWTERESARGIHAWRAMTRRSVEERVLVWKPHGLSKCLMVLDECHSLTRCWVSVNHEQPRYSSLRMGSDDMPEKETEIEVDLRSEYEVWRKSLKRIPKERDVDAETNDDGEKTQDREPSARELRAKRRRTLADRSDSNGAGV